MYTCETAQLRVSAIAYKQTNDGPLFLVLELVGSEHKNHLMLLTAKTYRGQGWHHNIIDCARKKLNLAPNNIIATRALHGGSFDPEPYIDGGLRRYCCLLETNPGIAVDANPKYVKAVHWFPKPDAAAALRTSHREAFLDALKRAEQVVANLG